MSSYKPNCQRDDADIVHYVNTFSHVCSTYGVHV